MAEDVPRRMKRFYRENETPKAEELKKRLTGMAIKEVDTFREKHSRFPEKEHEIEEISESLFRQLKDELKGNEKSAEKIQEEEIGALAESATPGESGSAAENGKTFLERRKERRGRQGGNAAAEKPGRPENSGSPFAGKHGKRRRGKIGGEAGAEDESGKGSGEDETAGEESGEEAGMDMPEIPELASESETGENEGVAEGGEGMESLAGIDELSSLEQDLKEGSDDFDLIEKEVQTDSNVCPNCKSKAEQLVYCPQCGTAFCDHCAKKVEVQQEALKYTCPKCGTEFKKKKAV